METRYQTLDGWRGISILLVLLGHLFPLGPKAWQLNGSIASCGMAIFFILSGFLITSILLRDQNIAHFLTRRFLRIVPLAWLAIFISLIATASPLSTYLPHLLFYANWPPMALTQSTGHLWSLCVEMQFYVLVALLVLMFKKHAFVLLPILCLAVTGYRFINDVPMAINTYYRLDEILAGCILALIYHNQSHKYSATLRHFIGKLSPIYLFPLLIISAHPDGGFINYLRPYIALLLIGSTLFAGQALANQTAENKATSFHTTWYSKWLNGRFLFYLASISYALYVIHGGLMDTWLGEGEKLEKYLKRPLLLAVTFALAHISTFYFEKHWINLAKKLTKKPIKNNIANANV
jgi:peptidoglycan/LPS O-acetylase OafA/YrhL